MKNKKIKKYLVIGGAGFIGSHLSDRLLNLKNQVTILDNLSTGKKKNINPKAKFFKADIRNLKQILPYFKNIDGVFLLAALPQVEYSINYPRESNENNLNGTLNVLVASQQAKVKKIVYSSSSAIYGNTKKTPIKEIFKSNPLSPYALQKLAGEEYCRLFSLIHNLETVSLRYFNVYGTRMNNKGAYINVISIFINQLTKKQPLTITGNGKQTRDFVHINDVVEANILAMNSKKTKQGEVINIGSGKSYSINKIANMFSSKIKYITRRLEPYKTLADISLAKKLLNWEPKVKLKQGIKEIIKY